MALATEGGDVPTRSASTPSADLSDMVAQVNSFYDTWRQDRRPYEIQWFVNAAMIRGQQTARWNPALNRLTDRNAKLPAHRRKNTINRILPKVRARLAKFVKTRPYPQVIPANTDRESVMNAKATEKVIDFQWRRMGLETKYEDALLWAMTTGKSFWWFRWNSETLGRLQEPGPEFGGSGQIHEIPLGDVEVEVGTAFELLVQDPGIPRIQDQPRIMRVKVREVSEVKARYGAKAKGLEGDCASSDVFQYQKQIAELGAKNLTGFTLDEKSATSPGGYSHVVVKELFIRPNAEYPKGRYTVVAGSTLLKDEDSLPYDFGQNASNPYPVVEFIDTMTAGQFWPTTLVEQLIGIQREYNELRNKVGEQIAMQAHPKFIAPTQANLNPNAYNSEAGEKIFFHYIPGMPLPSFLQPPSITGDIWRALEIIRIEFDDLTSIYPASVGAGGDNGESGFQTNLLQEASDSVHAPDIRRNELSIEEAAFKVRRFMFLGYDVPRLLSIVGKSHQPEVFEFSSENIDEHAHIVVQAGSALPTLKAARAKMVMEMHSAGLFGDPNDPATKRRVLGMLEVGGIEDATDILKRDEDQARLENLDISKSMGLEAPMPWENHQVHYEFHTDLLKSPEIKLWQPAQRDELIRHVIMHARFINPMNALMLAQQFGYADLAAQIMPMVQAPAGAPPAGPSPSPQGPQPPDVPPAPAAPAGLPSAA